MGELGPRIKADTTEEAAKADIVFVAVRWVDLKAALGGLPAWNGRVVVDATNPVEFLDPTCRGASQGRSGSAPHRPVAPNSRMRGLSPSRPEPSVTRRTQLLNEGLEPCQRC